MVHCTLAQPSLGLALSSTRCLLLRARAVQKSRAELRAKKARVLARNFPPWPVQLPHRQHQHGTTPPALCARRATPRCLSTRAPHGVFRSALRGRCVALAPFLPIGAGDPCAARRRAAWPAAGRPADRLERHTVHTGRVHSLAAVFCSPGAAGVPGSAGSTARFGALFPAARQKCAPKLTLDLSALAPRPPPLTCCRHALHSMHTRVVHPSLLPDLAPLPRNGPLPLLPARID